MRGCCWVRGMFNGMTGYWEVELESGRLFGGPGEWVMGVWVEFEMRSALESMTRLRVLAH